MRKQWSLLFLVLIIIGLNADQMIISPNISIIERDLRINDAQIGYIASSFTIIGAIVSLLWGYWSDKYQRRKLMFVTVLVGEVPCFLSAFAQSYGELFFLRALTGIGIGGMYPVVFSYVSDVYDELKRAKIVTYLTVAIGMGNILGILVAGFIGPSYGWRFPFVLVSLPNIVLITLFYFFSKEPKRGASEYAVKDLVNAGLPYPGRVRLSDYKKLVTIPTNLFLFLQGIAGMVPWGAIPFFLITFLNRYKGLSIQSATAVFLVFGLGNLVGEFSGGIIGAKLYKIKARYMPLFCSVTTAIGAFLVLWVLAIPKVDTTSGYITLLISGFAAATVISMTAPNVKTILMNVNDIENRGRIFSIFNLTDSLGAGIGKLVGGSLSAVLGSMMLALNISTLFWFVCAFLLIFVVVYIGRDLKKLHLKMEKIAEEMSTRDVRSDRQGV